MKFKLLLKESKFVWLLLFCMFSNFAVTGQNSRQITGIVSDSNGQPLPGASVLEKGTSNGAQTDFDGAFSLSVTKLNTTLVISYVGFSKQEISVKGQSNINVILEDSVSELDEMVIVGYSSKKRSDVTGAISSISSKDISEIEAPSVAQALQGKVSGVYVKNNSGQPGGGLSVRIRGIGGLNNSEPLYVVDGQQISPGESESSNPLIGLNPNDIESVEVLKDGSSTAIYGSRGANGVVIITTKKGNKDGTSQISFNSTYGTQTLLNVGGLDVLNAREFATVVNATQQAAGLAPTFDGSSALFPLPSALGDGTDHFEEIIQIGSTQEHQLSLSSGNEKTQFYTSLNYMNQEGIIKTTSFDQIRARFNIDSKVSKKLTLGANINASYSNTNLLTSQSRTGEGGVIGRSLTLAPTIPIFNQDGTYAGPEDGFYPPTRTSLSRLENREGQSTNSGVTINVFARLELVKNLSFTSRAVGASASSKNPLFLPSFEEGTLIELQSTVSNGITKSNSYQWSNVLQYSNSFGQHNVSGLAGIESRENTFNVLNSSVKYNNDETRVVTSLGDELTTTEGFSQSSFASYFGNISYNFKSKYFLEGNIRRDGSSNFGPNNSWGVFPSVSAAWRITKEDFFNVPYIDELKIRGGYGEVGNDKVSPFQHIVALTNQNYGFGDQTGVATNGRVIDQLSNPNIRWETSKQSNIGIDMEMFKHKLTLAANYFRTEVTDMLIPVSIGATSGVSNNGAFLGLGSVDVNTGELINSGFEFEASYRSKIGDDFNFQVGANLTTYSNEVTDLSTNSEIFGATFQGQNLSRTIVGGSIGDFYGYVVDGIFQTQAEVDAANSLGDASIPYQGVGTAPGDFKYRDLNGDNVINDEDRETIGSPVPDFTYGFNLGLQYKNFDFSMSWYGVEGADIYNANRMDLEASARTNFNKSRSVLNAWSGAGTSNTIPRSHALDPNNNKRVSSVFVEDGSFLALRNLRIGYNLSENVCSKLKLSKFNIFASAQNLLIFTKYSGFDPEVGNINGGNQGAGIDNDFYPKAKTIHIGINVTL